MIIGIGLTRIPIPRSELGPAKGPFPPGLTFRLSGPPAFGIGITARPIASATLGIVPGAQQVAAAVMPTDAPQAARAPRDRDEAARRVGAAEAAAAGGAGPPGQAPDVIRQIGNVLGELANRAIRTAFAIAGGPTFGAVAAGVAPQPFRPTPRPVAMGAFEAGAGVGKARDRPLRGPGGRTAEGRSIGSVEAPFADVGVTASEGIEADGTPARTKEPQEREPRERDVERRQQERQVRESVQRVRESGQAGGFI